MPISRIVSVAVVDDDRRVLESLEELLESAGHSVRAFMSAKDFLDDNCLPEIDCLISDIGMPIIDGFELHRMALAVRPDLPVILITARHEATDRQRADAQGIRGLFRKPFDGAALLAAISLAVGTDQGEA